MNFAHLRTTCQASLQLTGASSFLRPVDSSTGSSCCYLLFDVKLMLRWPQEILTDPSYKGQFVVFTHVHIGNVGINFGALHLISHALKPVAETNRWPCVRLVLWQPLGNL